MQLRIEPVGDHNRGAVSSLRVAKHQQGFIETTAQCLAEADAQPIWRPVGLYDGDTLVGFAMYGLWPKEGTNGRAWLDRLLIDHSHQNKGYGKAALRHLIRRIAAEYDISEIYLSLYPENEAAMALYRAHGFVPTGEVDRRGEHVMVLNLRSAPPR